MRIRRVFDSFPFPVPVSRSRRYDEDESPPISSTDRAIDGPWTGYGRAIEIRLDRWIAFNAREESHVGYAGRE